MAQHHLRLIAVGVLALAATAAPGRGADANRPARGVVFAAGPAAASASSAAGGWRTELPWPLPGDGEVAVAPDGRRIAFVSRRLGNRDIFVVDAAKGEVRRLTKGRHDDRAPAWSPDGRMLAWQSGPPGRASIHVMRPDGTGARRITRGADDVQPAWSPAGTHLVFASNRQGGHDLWLVSVAGGAPELLLDEAADLLAPAWSPDGTRIAYVRTRVSGSRLALLDLTTLSARSVTGASARDLRPDWSPDGGRLAFTRVARGVSRTWIVTPGRPARPLPGSTGDADPDWARAGDDLAPTPDQLLPDLDQRAPADLVVLFADGAHRLGFTSAVENLGLGPVRISGWRAAGRRVMRADQIVERRGRPPLRRLGIGTLRYELHAPHRHWHFQEFENYELRRASDHRLVGRDRKSGFCLIDRYGRAAARIRNVGPPRFVSDCGANRPELQRVEQGSSRGYVDRYPAFFHGQDLRLSGVPAGVYVLVHRANPTRRLRELRYANNTASVRLRLAWPRGPGAAPTVTVLRRCEASEQCPA